VTLALGLFLGMVLVLAGVRHFWRPKNSLN
jgi:hypothetical protein